MLRIFKNSKKKTTTAIVENCSHDAIARIGKVMAARHNIEMGCDECDKRCWHETFALRLVPNANEALISDTIKATVTCDDRDTYTEAVGESEAVKKAMANHNKAFKRALKRWQVAMLKDIMAVSPETFEEALREVHPCKCEGFKH